MSTKPVKCWGIKFLGSRHCLYGSVWLAKNQVPLWKPYHGPFRPVRCVLITEHEYRKLKKGRKA